MKIGETPRTRPMRLQIKPQMVRLAQKDISLGEDLLQPDCEETSLFHSVSDIKNFPTSGLSYRCILEAKNTVQGLVGVTEKVSDLIEDGNTTLVFREVDIEASSQDIISQRYIVYQRAGSEGQIRLKSRGKTGNVQELDEEDEPFVFRQCTFYFCDTRDTKEKAANYLSVGIKIACEQKVRFIDCAFIGICYTATGSKTTGVDYTVFTDAFFKINLELTNCFFSGPKSILYTNFPMKSLVINQCTFDGIEAEGLSVTHPGVTLIQASQFFHCSSQVLSIKLYEEEAAEKPVKRTSGFAASKAEPPVVN